MPAFGNRFRLTLVTSDPALAGMADRAGVDRICLDLERLGKAERQRGEDTRLSNHRLHHLPLLAAAIGQAELMARVNPINAGSRQQIETAIRHGAKALMLPFFSTAAEVSRFVQLVDRRARIIILLETGAALVRIREILAVAGVDEIMLGLNDLRLQLGVHNHFEVLASPLIDCLATEIHRKQLPFSMGGVALPDDTDLPVGPDLVLAQFPRLGATGAWLSRSFFRRSTSELELGEGVAAIRRRLSYWAEGSSKGLEQARADLAVAAHRSACDARSVNAPKPPKRARRQSPKAASPHARGANAKPRPA